MYMNDKLRTATLDQQQIYHPIRWPFKYFLPCLSTKRFPLVIRIDPELYVNIFSFAATTAVVPRTDEGIWKKITEVKGMKQFCCTPPLVVFFVMIDYNSLKKYLQIKTAQERRRRVNQLRIADLDQSTQ